MGCIPKKTPNNCKKFSQNPEKVFKKKTFPRFWKTATYEGTCEKEEFL